MRGKRLTPEEIVEYELSPEDIRDWDCECCGEAFDSIAVEGKGWTTYCPDCPPVEQKPICETCNGTGEITIDCPEFCHSSSEPTSAEEWVLTYTREDLHPGDLYTFEDMEEAYKAGQKNCKCPNITNYDDVYFKGHKAGAEPFKELVDWTHKMLEAEFNSTDYHLCIMKIVVALGKLDKGRK